MRTTEDAVDFEAAMRNFEIKVDSIRKNIQARGEAIDAALQNALRILSEHSKEALLEVADRSARLFWHWTTRLSCSMPSRI